MDSRNYVLKESAMVLIGEVICCAAMVGIFALLGDFSKPVVLGAAVGAILATLNFFFMALGADLAAGRAQNDNVKSGQMLIQLSYMGRMIALFLILVLCAKSGYFNLIALVVPLVFVRPILTIAESFKKKGAHDV